MPLTIGPDGFGAAEPRRGQLIAEFIAQLRHDVRYAFRQIRCAPVLAVALILTLGIGIGATTAIYSLLDALAFRTLPVRDPSGLVLLEMHTARGPNSYFSYPMYERLRDGASTLSGLAAIASLRQVNAVVGGQPAVARADAVTGNFFDLLGVDMTLGRSLTEADDRAVAPVAVITDAYWHERFGGNPRAVGTLLRIDGVDVEIVGVIKAPFAGVKLGRSIDILVPLGLVDRLSPDMKWRNAMTTTWLQLIGRRKTGASETVVGVELAGVFTRLAADIRASSSNTPAEVTLSVVSAASGIEKSAFISPLRLLLIVAFIVLFVACGNVAGLLFARAEARARDIGVCLALGAGRGRLLRQLLTENLLLASLGFLLGVSLAVSGASELARMAAGVSGAFRVHVGVDYRVLGFSAAATVLATLLFGLAPSISAALRPATSFAANVRTASLARSRHAGTVLLSVQFALSLALVFAAGLFVQSIRNSLAEEGGFNRHGVLSLVANPKMARLDSSRAFAYYTRALDVLGALPGVSDAAVAISRPVNPDAYFTSSFGYVDGRQMDAGRRVRFAFNAVSEAYFRTLQISVVRGRSLTRSDGPGSPRVVVINRTLARALFGDQDPIGRSVGGNEHEQFLVVGVVGDTKYADMISDVRGVVYYSIYQWRVGEASFMLRSSLLPGSSSSTAKKALAAVDASVPITRVTTLDMEAADALVRQRMLGWVAGAFGIIAVTLACVGLYGLAAFNVRRRTAEIGVRMALGASPTNVLMMVFVRSLGVVAFGLMLGAPLALGLARFARGMLYGLAPSDSLTFLAAVGILTAAAILAAAVPAQRAARIDPCRALASD